MQDALLKALQGLGLQAKMSRWKDGNDDIKDWSVAVVERNVKNCGSH